MRSVSSIGTKFHQSTEYDERQIADEDDIISNTQRLKHRLVASVQISVKQEIAIESAIRKQQRQVAKLVTEQLVKYIHIDTVPGPPKNPNNIRQPRDFLSA